VLLPPEKVEALLQHGKAIYGSDSRVEAQGAARVPPGVIRAVCVLVETKRLQPAPGGYALQTESFGAKYNLCPGQRFRDQPLVGYGSGFLVAPDVIATAGHCIEGFDVSSVCALFDFELRNNRVELARPSSEVYFVAEVLRIVVESEGADYALVRLDRPVRGVEPLPVRAHDVVLGEPVYVVGHPVGLPKKVAQGAKVMDVSPKAHFLANLDTFGGNSGSPVLTDDNTVCGILVRGAPDFVVKGNCVVATTFPLNTAGESVCRASVWRGSVPIDKLSRLIDVSASGTPTSDDKPVHRAFREVLESFLCSAFSLNQLRRLVRYNLVLEPLINEVNWNGSLSAIAQEIVEFLEHHALIGDDFFNILEAERPRRAAEVEKIRSACAARKHVAAAPAAPARVAPKRARRSHKRPIDRRTVYEALLALSPLDFNVLIDVQVDQEARLVVGSRGGQSEMALALIAHYDVPYRGLDRLAEAIRRVVPRLI
jgi:hypothetical protein